MSEDIIQFTPPTRSQADIEFEQRLEQWWEELHVGIPQHIIQSGKMSSTASEFRMYQPRWRGPTTET